MPQPSIEILRRIQLKEPIRFALFDFDGTISTIRQGWEDIMVPMMVEMICGGPCDDPEVRREVEAYVDESTGIQTILQMEWLAEAVRRHGRVAHPLDAQAYKAIYNARLLRPVRDRLDRLSRGILSPGDLSIAGSIGFVRALYERGLTLFLASGTDEAYVRNEAEHLGIAPFFRGGLFGALRTFQEYSKEKVIRRILQEHDLHGEGLMVVGDGPVEIRHARAAGAVAVGVASDEIRRRGWNERKRERLIRAGAHLLIPDFEQADHLLDLIHL